MFLSIISDIEKLDTASYHVTIILYNVLLFESLLQLVLPM